jgi:hypothetical protein
LPVDDGEGDPQRVFVMLEKDGLQLLVVVRQLKLHFWKVLLEIDLDNVLQRVLLLLKGELSILEYLCEH